MSVNISRCNLVSPLEKAASDQPVYSHKSAVVDKNPKTCADDHIWETVRFVHDYFKKAGKASGG